MNVTGTAAILDHVAGLATAWALLWTCAALGLRLLERFDLDLRPGESLLFAVPLGCGALGAAVLLLGLGGGFRPLPLILLLIAAVLAALPALAPTTRAAKQLGREIWSESRLLVLVLATVFVGLTLQAAAPPSDWDSLIYHLQVPRDWLAEGRIVLPADNLHAAFVGLWHMLYVPLLAVGASAGPAVLNAGVAVLLAVGLREFGRRWFDARTGRIAAIVVWGSPIFLLVAVTARVDVSLAVFLLAAHHAAFAALYEKDDGATWAVLAALLLGLAIGVKLLAAPYVVALVPIGMLLIARRRIETGTAWLWVAGALVIGALPWLAQKWLLFGDPVYPFLSSRLLEPWLRPLYDGAAHVPADVGLDFTQAEWRLIEPLSLRSFLLSPRELTHEAEGALYLGNLMFLLLPLVLFRLREERLILVVVGAALFVGPVVGPDLKVNLRYLIPGLVLGTLASSRLLSWAANRVSWKRTTSTVARGFVGIALVPAVLPFVFLWSRMPTFEYLSGEISARTYLEHNENPDVHLYGRMSEWVNRELGPDDRVLLIFEGRGYYLDPPALQDNLLANWPLISARSDEAGCLEEFGVTHVIVNLGVLGVYVGGGVDPELLAWDHFPAFAERCLERVHSTEVYGIYRVVPSGGERKGPLRARERPRQIGDAGGG